MKATVLSKQNGNLSNKQLRTFGYDVGKLMDSGKL